VLRPRQQGKLAWGAKDVIGKNSFHVVGHDKRGAILLRQKWSRGLGGLCYDELHSPARHRLGDRFGVPEVILCSLEYGRTYFATQPYGRQRQKIGIGLFAAHLV
jgi:hypothetical protein